MLPLHLREYKRLLLGSKPPIINKIQESRTANKVAVELRNWLRILRNERGVWCIIRREAFLNTAASR